MQRTSRFEGGVAGNTISVADQGSDDAFSDRQFSVDATLQYSSVQKYQTLSCEMVFSATPGSCYVEWNGLGANTTVYGRIYMYHAALPSTLHNFVRGFETAIGRAWECYVDSSGHLVVRDSGGTVRGTGAVAMATGQWVRVEFKAVNSTTAGVVEAKLFNNADSSSPDETITSTGSFSTLSQTDLVRFGEQSGLNASRTVYMDNLVFNDTGYPGPYGGPIPSTAFMKALGW